MKLHVKAFTLSAVTVITIPMSILFIWCAANQFGYEAVVLFEKIHPSGAFAITASGTTFVSKIAGILIAIFYTAADSFILSFAFASLYNFLCGGDSRKNKK